MFGVNSATQRPTVTDTVAVVPHMDRHVTLADYRGAVVNWDPIIDQMTNTSQLKYKMGSIKTNHPQYSPWKVGIGLIVEFWTYMVQVDQSEARISLA